MAGSGGEADAAERSAAAGDVVADRMQLERVRVQVEHAEPRTGSELARLADAARVDDVSLVRVEVEPARPLLLALRLRADDERAVRMPEHEHPVAGPVDVHPVELGERLRRV